MTAPQWLRFVRPHLRKHRTVPHIRAFVARQRGFALASIGFVFRRDALLSTHARYSVVKERHADSIHPLNRAAPLFTDLLRAVTLSAQCPL